MTRLRALCLNLWNVNDPFPERMAALDEYVGDTAPDVLLLQEVSPHPRQHGVTQLAEVGALRPYHTVYCQTGDWRGRSEGLAVAARSKVSCVQFTRLPGHPDDMDRGVLHVGVECAGRTVHIFNTHLAFLPAHAEVRMDQAMKLARLVEPSLSGGSHVMVGGDFNDIPTSSAIQEFCAALPSLTLATSDAVTFASENRFVDPRLVPDRCIDYLFVGPTVRRVTSRMVLNDPSALASDHYGLEVEVELS